jgi:galactokinase
MQRIETSAPGRICLFGEHHDYLNLPVIAQAIDLRVRILGEYDPSYGCTTPSCIFHLPDLGTTERFTPSTHPKYTHDRDYLQSVFAVLIRHGVGITQSHAITIKGEIPINSGTSSSSAMISALIKYLLTTANHPDRDNLHQIALWANEAEVTEFGEAGGWMDHFACTFGNTLFIDASNNYEVTLLRNPPGTFILIDSGEPKDTVSILRRVKMGVIDALLALRSIDPTFNMMSSPLDHALDCAKRLPSPAKELVIGNIHNRELTQAARFLFEGSSWSDEELGRLLTQHHYYLDTYLGVSTPKINRLLEAAIAAGALGGKINGSGGGGCLFVYAPQYQERIAEAVMKEGGTPYLVHSDTGVTEDMRLDS